MHSKSRKPFVGTLRVIKPVRQRLASDRKRVLRGGGVTRPAKRRQPVPSCVIEPRKSVVGALVVVRARAVSVRCNGLAYRSCRGRRTGHRHNGGSSGT
jgi:hypothetical protein